MTITYLHRDAEGHHLYTFTSNSTDNTVIAVDNSCAEDGRRDGREDLVLNVEVATKLRDVLDEYLATEAEKARAAHTATLQEYYEAARALPVGTRVKISDAPLYEVGTEHPEASDLAGKTGTVHNHIDGDAEVGHYAAYGVQAGRVAVRLDSDERYRRFDDIHVSSLEVIPEPVFDVGDRVEVYGYSEFWNGPAKVTDALKFGTVSVLRDGWGEEMIGAFHPSYLRPLPPIDYAALAATFNPGDMAIVGDNPSLSADRRYGVRVEDFAGKAVNVVAPGLTDGVVAVERGVGNDADFQYIHVAHLTRAVPDPA